MAAVRISESSSFDQASRLCGGRESPHRWPCSATCSSDARRADGSRSLLAPFVIQFLHMNPNDKMLSETASHPLSLGAETSARPVEEAPYCDFSGAPLCHFRHLHDKALVETARARLQHLGRLQPSKTQKCGVRVGELPGPRLPNRAFTPKGMVMVHKRAEHGELCLRLCLRSQKGLWCYPSCLHRSRTPALDKPK